MSRPDVFVLCRSKRSNRNASATLEQALVERGIKAYRVTPNINPKWDPSRIHTVINHGVGDTPIWADRLPDDVVWFNSPMTVKLSANKALMTEALQQAGVPCLDSTHNRFTASLALS
jgi:glutathione synthase/RimK-type ligase-like ATP-grasp enzyme